MKIEEYSFGRITINGRTYTHDVIIYPDRVDDSWRRKQGHRLDIDDVSDLLQAGPDLLIIGTGYNGVMAVPQETLAALSRRGLQVRVESTPRAVRLFNDAPKDKTVIAALHLTC